MQIITKYCEIQSLATKNMVTFEKPKRKGERKKLINFQDTKNYSNRLPKKKADELLG
jgi:hypothetical protein